MVEALLLEEGKIELVGGQIVRDERQGGYQTQTIPVQGFGAYEVAP